MSEHGPRSAFFIGSEPLAAQCAEVWLERGHELRGIITDAGPLRAWAESKGVPALDASGDYSETLEKASFDYLFSVTHLAIIPARALGCPRRGAINFHDGALPRYAGLNTPSWALIQGEDRWAVTFHEITTGIDEGAILLQRWFDVGRRETALTLNARCFEEGLEGFRELVERLESDRLAPKSQLLTARRYFGRADRPPRAGVIDWREPAAQIDRRVRATDYGRYANRFGVMKIRQGGRVLVVRQGEPVAGEGRPGEILTVDGDGWTVATGDGAFRVTGATTIDGREMSPREAAEALGVAAGSRLDVLDDATAGALDEAGRAVFPSEPRLERRLERLEPVHVPHATAAPTSDRIERIPLELPEAFRRRHHDQLEAAVAAGFATYLARTEGRAGFHVAFSDRRTPHPADPFPELFSRVVPLEVRLDLDAPFSRAVERLGRELDRLREHQAFPREVMGRLPSLRGSTLEIPVGLVLTSGTEPLDSLAGRALTLQLTADQAWVAYDPAAFGPDGIEALRRDLCHLFEASGADVPLCQLELLSKADRARVLESWNDTARSAPLDGLVHRAIEAQVDRTPSQRALTFEGASMSYAELDERANALAAHLASLGVRPGSLVAVACERDPNLVVALLATLKAGAAYVPVDPEYPAERIALMLRDSGASVVITASRLTDRLPPTDARLVRLDREGEVEPERSTSRLDPEVSPSDLAYVIYTSGSTGRPKGVMVEHRNVLNFFSAMDDRVGAEPPGVWFAVTSPSFDISVLELFWTLARGFEVVLWRDRDRELPPTTADIARTRSLDFGLFLWGNDDGPGPQKYRLMLEGARFFDENGFQSVWTPERHFRAFGGPYPNPAVTGAALAAITKNLRIQAGSCVLPLHHPIRVAEEWSLVDNLSGGRVGISIASGWQPHDFILRPENYPGNKDAMWRDIEILQRLWRGEAVTYRDFRGEETEIRSLPRPVQPELPIWITVAGSPDTWNKAGLAGHNVLTHLLGQSLSEIKERIDQYKRARATGGHDPEAGRVTLMLHTFVGESDEQVRELVREPMRSYLASSVNLLKQFAWTFPAFKRPESGRVRDLDLSSLGSEEMDAILDHAFERYFTESGLFGSEKTCLEQVDRLKAAGVHEVACLVDFGVDTDLVLASLPRLAEVRRQANEDLVGASVATAGDHGLSTQFRRHGVTHMQCTPSMARMLLETDEGRDALGSLQHLFVGGEALPSDLANELRRRVKGRVVNMYGPTETTVWSSTHPVAEAFDGPVAPIGTPVAHTRMYVLDDRRQLLPIGVPGELYIGGRGVVRGYKDRPELTEERFVPDPFVPNQRMYRTGDRARWRSDGALEFLGRNDHQVKIRGHRIELPEIEARLREHSGVRDAVVVAREAQPGDVRLHAYVAGEASQIEAVEVKTWLAGVLPEAMLPSTVTTLDALPLTPNGKVDRNRLPDPTAERAREFEAPTNDLERTVAQVWREVLGVDAVGRRDNFFDLGGHSLLIVQAHRQLREQIEKPLTLTDMYRFPTVGALADFLTGGDAGGAKKGAERAARRLQMRRQTR